MADKSEVDKLRVEVTALRQQIAVLEMRVRNLEEAARPKRQSGITQNPRG